MSTTPREQSEWSPCNVRITRVLLPSPIREEVQYSLWGPCYMLKRRKTADAFEVKSALHHIYTLKSQTSRGLIPQSNLAGLIHRQRPRCWKERSSASPISSLLTNEFGWIKSRVRLDYHSMPWLLFAPSLCQGSCMGDQKGHFINFCLCSAWILAVLCLFVLLEGVKLTAILLGRINLPLPIPHRQIANAIRHNHRLSV